MVVNSESATLTDILPITHPELLKPNTVLSELYLLTYMYQNAAVRFKLVVFSFTDATIDQKVSSAKQLCGKNNWRFLWLEPAVEFLEII